MTQKPRGGARPGSGPKAGVPIKPKRALIALLQEKFPGYHPVVAMAKTANDPNEPPERRFAANKEVAKYVTPALKAVEHAVAEDANIEVTVRLVPFGED